jgi:hypothetical protein
LLEIAGGKCSCFVKEPAPCASNDLGKSHSNISLFTEYENIVPGVFPGVLANHEVSWKFQKWFERSKTKGLGACDYSKEAFDF